jgi:hypothetical protein
VSAGGAQSSAGYKEQFEDVDVFSLHSFFRALLEVPMRAKHDQKPRRSRDGGLFDILAITASLVIIVGGVFVVNAASMRYRVAGMPVANAAPEHSR